MRGREGGEITSPGYKDRAILPVVCELRLWYGLMLMLMGRSVCGNGLLQSVDEAIQCCTTVRHILT